MQNIEQPLETIPIDLSVLAGKLHVDHPWSLGHRLFRLLELLDHMLDPWSELANGVLAFTKARLVRFALLFCGEPSADRLFRFSSYGLGLLDAPLDASIGRGFPNLLGSGAAICLAQASKNSSRTLPCSKPSRHALGISSAATAWTSPMR